jgi:hypothetical protein
MVPEKFVTIFLKEQIFLSHSMAMKCAIVWDVDPCSREEGSSHFEFIEGLAHDSESPNTNS